MLTFLKQLSLSNRKSIKLIYYTKSKVLRSSSTLNTTLRHFSNTAISNKIIMPHYTYPNVKRDESIVENFHGTKIGDPYRWLEDPDSEETKTFVDEQNAVTKKFLDLCKHRNKIRDRITELWNYPKYSSPFKRGDSYFFFKNSGLQNQSVLYKQKDLESEPVQFLDPNKFAEDGTTALQQYDFSEDGKIFGYMICEKGSDWGKIKFKMVESGQDLDDVLENVKFSCLTWTHDNKGIFYNSFPKNVKADGTSIEKNEFQEVRYHVIGTKQSDDILVANFPENPNWMGHVEVSDCGRFLILGIAQSCDPTNQLWFYDLKQSNYEIKPHLPFVKLVQNFDAKYEYITNEGTVFTFKTNSGKALRYKLVSIDFDQVDLANPKWIELVPESEDVLSDVRCVNKTKLLLNYMHDCKDELSVYDLLTGKQLFKFPLEIGSLLEISGRKKNDFFFYKFGSFTSPGDIYFYDFNNPPKDNQPKLFRQSEFKGLDLSVFKTEQVFYTSKDGTKVPMFLVHKKDVDPKSGNNPVYLYGYGGFNISLTPSFSVVRLIWLQHFNGIYACANLRGGGEYGEEWYNAGRLKNKQNVFDDFISAAEYLIDNKYTKKEKLVINGGSNGGLLVTACVNQRPDLYQAVVGDVAVCDMLRFHKFTIGSYWVSDYGSADEESDFNTMIKYSPLHTINKDKKYPYVILFTADHDDRVVPSHSYKYIAELQHLNGAQENAFLLRIETKAGHGAGKPTSKIIDEYADKFGFIGHVLDLEWTD